MVSAATGVAGGQTDQKITNTIYMHAYALLMIPRRPGICHGPQTSWVGANVIRPCSSAAVTEMGVLAFPGLFSAVLFALSAKLSSLSEGEMTPETALLTPRSWPSTTDPYGRMLPALSR